MELKKVPSFKNRPVYVTQKTNIKFDINGVSDHSTQLPQSVDGKPKASSQHTTKSDKSGSRSRRNSISQHEDNAEKNECDISQITIDNFLEQSSANSTKTVLSRQDSAVARTRIIEEMYRINERANISMEERQRLYQIAVTMDAPRLARKLVADANELRLESIEGASFLTGNMADFDECSTTGRWGEPSRPVDAEVVEDERFCKAVDEVERIRSRIIQRATVTGSSPATVTLPSISTSTDGASRSLAKDTSSVSDHGVCAAAGPDSNYDMDMSRNRSLSPKGAVTVSTAHKKFDKPLLLKKTSSKSRLLQREASLREAREASVTSGVSEGDLADREMAIVQAIDQLIGDSRPSSGRRTQAVRGSDAGSSVFHDPFAMALQERPQSASSRADELKRMEEAQEELVRVQSRARTRVGLIGSTAATSMPKHGGDTPLPGAKVEGFRKHRTGGGENDAGSSDSDLSSGAQRVQPAMRRFSGPRSQPHPVPAELSMSVINGDMPGPKDGTDDVSGDDTSTKGGRRKRTPHSFLRPPPSTHRLAPSTVSTPSSVSSSSRAQLNAKMRLLSSSPMSDWLHIGKSLSEDEGPLGNSNGAPSSSSTVDGGRASSVDKGTPNGGYHPTIHEERVPRGHARHSGKFSFDEALVGGECNDLTRRSRFTERSDTTVAIDLKPRRITHSHDSASNDGSRVPPGDQPPLSVESSVDVLKAYSGGDRGAIDSVRRKLLSLNGYIAEASAGTASAIGGESGLGHRQRRNSKDLRSDHYMGESSDGSKAGLLLGRQLSVGHAALKSSSSSGLIAKDASGHEGTSVVPMRSRAGSRLSALEVLSPHKSPRSPRGGADALQHGVEGGIHMSQSRSVNQLGAQESTRLSALAAALDAGDAVGRLMAEMLVRRNK